MADHRAGLSAHAVFLVYEIVPCAIDCSGTYGAGEYAAVVFGRRGDGLTLAVVPSSRDKGRLEIPLFRISSVTMTGEKRKEIRRQT